MLSNIKKIPGWQALSQFYWGQVTDDWVFSDKVQEPARNPSIYKQLPRGYQAFVKLLEIVAQSKLRPLVSRVKMFRLIIGLFHPFRSGKEFSLAVSGVTTWIKWADPRAFGVIKELADVKSDAHLLSSLLEEGDLFVDIGANHGSFSLLSSQKVGPSGKVICFEPQSDLARLVSKSFESNKFTQSSVISKALGSQKSSSTLFVPEGSSGTASLYEATSESGKGVLVEVDVVTGDEVFDDLQGFGKAVVKIDVEGAEIEVLKGAQKFIREWHPWLILELNPTTWTASHSKSDDLIPILYDLGYKSYYEMSAFDKAVSLDNVKLEMGVRNVLFR